MGDPSNQAKAIFLEALEGPAPEQWPAFLEQACAGDAGLRAEVERLLRARAELGSFHEAPAPALFATAEEAIREVPGSAVGPYKLLEQIGEGGMGTVWMAQQTEPVKRLVAVKLIKAGMDSRQVIARFEAERQALALMDHANIARVLDAGTTSAGRPYFVMDLVKGVPITRYCDEHHLTPRQRLELFVLVCSAVQHAHQKGIIHRDLKPSNVLVAHYDGQPVPKVIDFGVAKATGQTLTDKTLVTGYGAIVGTLEYMSPEQAEVNQLDIDTRSDIYSLGVLLYELLTGSPPFSRKELEKAGMLEMLRVIREKEPSKPSTKLSTADGLPTLAANRGTEPGKLTRLMRGELDWIVMKALEKDRNRRYESANGFAMDVQRYLADEPVLACPPSAGYRLRKFARRNRGRLTAAAVLGVALLAVVGATAGSIGWAVRNREARLARLTGQVETILEETARLEQEQKWPEALAAVERAEAVAGDEADDALRQHVAAVRRDLEFIAELERIRQERAATVEGKLNNAGAAAHYAGGFRGYGLDMEALAPEEVADRLRAKPALAVAIAAALDDWVDARRDLDEEESSWRPLVAVARGLDHDPLRNRLRAVWSQPFTPELQAELRRLAESIDVKAQRPATLIVLANTLERVHLSDAALRILQDGQQAYWADFWLNFYIGSYLYARQDYAAALRYNAAAVSLRPDSSSAHNNLGAALDSERKPDEADAEFRKAIALDPKNAHAHANLGKILRDRGKVEEAIACCREAIEVDPKCAWAHNLLGSALSDQKKWEESVACYQKTIELAPKYADAHYNLGNALYAQKKLDEAIVSYQKAIGLVPKYSSAHNNLGNALLAQGKQDEAIACFQKAIEADPNNAVALTNLGYMRRQQGKRDEAIECFQKANESNPNYARAHYELGNALREQGKWDEVVVEYRKAVRAYSKYAIAHYELGVVLSDQKHDYGGAVAAFRKAIDLDGKNAGIHYQLGIALERQGKLEEAITAYREAVALNPKYVAAQNQLANACARLGRWDEALAAEDIAAGLAPQDHYRLYLAAALQLPTGDQEGYYRICREMLERFGDTKDPGVAEHVAKTCLLMPDAVADHDRVLKLARWAVTQNSNDRWLLLCVALAEYRAGRSAEALSWLERFAPKAAYGWPSEGSALAVLALVQLHQGRHEDALAALDQAEMVATKMPNPADGWPFGDNWQDWLHCQALLGEAEKVIKPDEARLHFYRGSRRRGQDKWSEAEAEYREATRLRPNWYEAYYQLAVAIWEQGRRKDAQAAFRDALRRAPKPPVAVGPPRATFVTPWSDTDQWVVKGQEVHQLDEKRGHIMLFGDPDWADYDFEAEVEIIAGGSEVGLIFRATDRDDYMYAVIGGWGNTGHAILIAHKGAVGIGFVKGQSKKGCRYRMRVEVRRERVKMFLDDKFLMTIDAGERLRGCVGLVTNPVHARFRNLKVTDATGKVLWEGVQDVLPTK